MISPHAELSEILARLEKATGPDRELDCRLSHHFDRKGISYGTGDDSGWAPAKTVDGWDEAKWSTMGAEHVSSLVPHYTASIDAALALVERVLPDWGSAILSWSAGGKYPVFRIERSHPTNIEIGAEGHTRPLAILIALLRALSTIRSTHP